MKTGRPEKKECLILDYGAGNIQSVQFALDRIGCKGVLSCDPEEVWAAERVIFPGVGQAESAMRKLKASGLDLVIPQLRQPVLGICLGMQLMCTSTQEGSTQGMGIFDVDVYKFPSRLKVPSVGWNKINGLQTELFSDVEEQDYIYMIHSYYVPVCASTIATSDYGLTYSAALHKDNFFAVQFHPEKSGPIGEKILWNFLNFKLKFTNK